MSEDRWSHFCGRPKCKTNSENWICWATAISCLLQDFADSENKTQKSIEPCSPWNSFENWRVGIVEPHRVKIRNQNGAETEIQILGEKNNFLILQENADISVKVSAHDDLLDLTWNNSGLGEYGHHLLVLRYESQLLAVYETGRTFFNRMEPLDFKQSEEVNDFRLVAPMPGNVIRVMVKPGENVIAGWSVAPISVLFVLFIFLIEILVAFLQAYIFTLLSAVFIGLAVKEEDH